MRCAMPHWPRSLRARLLAVYAVAMVASALVVGLLVAILAEPFDRHMLQPTVTGFAEGIAGRVRFGPDGVPAGFDENHIEPWALTSFGAEMAVRIVDPAGRVVYAPTGDTDALAPAGLPFAPARDGFILERDGIAMHAATTAVAGPHGARWYVQFAASDRLLLQLRDSFSTPGLHRGMLFIGILFLAVFLVATHLTLQRMLKPLGVAATEAQRITPQTLDTRLRAGDLPRELSPLIDAFNRALDRLQAGFRTQQEFLANAAHELKTPLALIRAQLEVEAPGTGNPHLLQDVDHMARQVQQLLHLAEASEPRNYRIADIDAHGAVAEACAYMARMAEQGRVRIAYHVEPAATAWQADRGALFTLFKNLLENAIQHSPPGGGVTLIADAAGFTVADQGAGVGADGLGRLFERFWRSAARRDVGAGLGLSICLEIARAHGWRIEARPGAPGLAVQVTFRTASDSAPQE